jgi:hypothetical protein
MVDLEGYRAESKVLVEKTRCEVKTIEADIYKRFLGNDRGLESKQRQNRVGRGEFAYSIPPRIWTTWWWQSPPPELRFMVSFRVPSLFP